jgi:serine/threonine-protein kinase
MSLSVGTRLGPYEVLSTLGAGGMGEVYRARDVRLGREVAVKVLPAALARDSDRLRRFEQEARAAGRLNHPNVVAVYDIGTYEGAPYVVEELLEGETLRERLSAPDRPPLGAAEVIDLGIQIAQGLCAAHEQGLVHRDVKPENIFLRSDGFVKVLDFGLVKLTEREPAPADSGMQTLVKLDTEPGVIVGTTKYMSPEQARGEAVDARTDVFSLGVVLYEMIAGHLPFDGPTPSDVLVAILTREPAPLSGSRGAVPDVLQRVVAAALRKSRDQRYASSRELLDDLKGLKQKLEVEAALASSSSGTAEARVASGSGEARRPPRRARSRRSVDSLAVLPLANSGGPDAEYLSDGITESLINSLARLPKLRVVSRSTAFRYKGREVDPHEAGRELGVRAVLTGRVLRVGDALVIRTELVDVEEDSQLWGEQYRRELTDIFALQDEISRDISEKLRPKLTGEERKRITKRYTENTEAYHLYLKGRYFTNRRTNEWLVKGVEHFQQAIAVDPSFALAYAGLADAYALLGSSTGGRAPSDTYPRAKAAALKALEIDESLAEAHNSLGFFRLLYDWDWPAARLEFKRAIELNPSYAPAHDGYGFYCKALGRHEEAVAACERARDLDPLSPFFHISIGWAYYFARDYEAAIENDMKAVELDAGSAFAYWNIGLAEAQLGRKAEAVVALRRAAELSSGLPAFLGHLGYVYGAAGRGAEARALLGALDQRAAREYVSPYYRAIIHVGLGQADAAFEWLERAYAERASFLAYLAVEPALDPLRGAPRFADLVRRVGLDEV